MRWKWKLRNNRGVLEDFKRKSERETRKRKEKKKERRKRKRKKKKKIFSLPSKTVGCFSGHLMSAASDQKLFCKLCSPFNCSLDEFVREKVVSPSYCSAILTPPTWLILTQDTKTCVYWMKRWVSTDLTVNCLGSKRVISNFGGWVRCRQPFPSNVLDELHFVHLVTSPFSVPGFPCYQVISRVVV